MNPPSSMKIRLVRCPRCRQVLAELPDISLYRCGGCGTTLQVHFVKKIKDKKIMHQQALGLIKCLCTALESLPSSEASTIYGRALSLAAQNNIREVVEVILDMFPTAINTTDTKTEVTIFHVAARARSENVFNLLHQMKEGKHFFYDCIDSSDNNYMHMCGEQAPTHKLNLVSGAALQMQRELHWFKEIEEFVTPSRRTSPNKEGKTPQMLFTEKHKELKSQGEKWMKDTATSCTIAAALIATVVFAAPFTVPGGAVYVKLANCYFKSDSKHEAANAYADAAHCYKKTNIKESISCLQQSVNLFLDIGRLNMSARYCKEIAELYEQEQNLEQTIVYYEKAADLFQSEEVSSSANQCRQKVAEFSAQLEQYQKAIEIYEDIGRQSLNNNLLKYGVKRAPS